MMHEHLVARMDSQMNGKDAFMYSIICAVTAKLHAGGAQSTCRRRQRIEGHVVRYMMVLFPILTILAWDACTCMDPGNPEC